MDDRQHHTIGVSAKYPMQLSDLTEAPIAELSAIKDRIQALSSTLASQPFGLTWDLRSGRLLREKANAAIDASEPGQYSELDAYEDYFKPVWRDLVIRTFFKVEREIKDATLEYQAHRGEQLDGDAGYVDDMHYIESSNWLTGAQLQTRIAATIRFIEVGNFRRGLTEIVTALETFTEDWKALQQESPGDEITLCDSLRDGIANTVPLIVLIASLG